MASEHGSGSQTGGRAISIARSLWPILALGAGIAAFSILRPAREATREMPGPREPAGRVAATHQAGADAVVSAWGNESGNRAGNGTLRLTGRLLDGPGNAVAGALAFGLVPGSRSVILAHGTSSERGEFELLLPTETPHIDLAIYSTRHRPVWKQGVRTDTSLSVTMREGWQLKGEVVDQRGTPLGGARIYVMGPGVPMGPELDGAPPVPPYLDRRVVISATDGTFSAFGLDPDHSYWVSAWAPGLAGSYEKEVTELVEVGEGVGPLRIPLYPAYRLQVRFVDAETGLAVHDERMTITDMSIELPSRDVGMAAVSPLVTGMSASTPIDSTWVAPQSEDRVGPFMVSLGSWAGYADRSEPVFAYRCASPSEAVPVEEVLVRRGPEFREPGILRVNFHVKDETAGEVFDSVGLRGMLVQEDGSFRCALDLQADSGGAVEIGRVPPGRYTLTFPELGATGPFVSRSSATVESHAVATLEVAFPRTGGVRLEVPAHQVPDMYATVILVRQDDGLRYEFEEASFGGGAATLRFILPGSYAVACQFPGSSTRRGAVEVRAGAVSPLQLRPLPK